MPEYRIEAQYENYTIQKKYWFGWKNCLRDYGYEGTSFPKTFKTYEAAVEQYNKIINRNNEASARNLREKSFGTKIYYPPFPQDEPTE